MPNKNYIKGRRKEYNICTQLKKQGYIIAQRTAGSHSPIDVIAIHKEKMEILFVQSKPEGYKEKKYDQWLWMNGYFKVRFEIR